MSTKSTPNVQFSLKWMNLFLWPHILGAYTINRLHIIKECFVTEMLLSFLGWPCYELHIEMYLDYTDRILIQLYYKGSESVWLCLPVKGKISNISQYIIQNFFNLYCSIHMETNNTEFLIKCF